MRFFNLPRGRAGRPRVSLPYGLFKGVKHRQAWGTAAILGATVLGVGYLRRRGRPA
jgi:hypothetical protein